MVSSQQMLTWLDGRNSSSFGSLSWNGSSLSFTIVVGTGARNLRAMVPANSTAGTLTALTLNGSAVSFTTQTIKGVQYAFFAANAGSYVAKYAAGLRPSPYPAPFTGTGGDAATVTLTSGTTTVGTVTSTTAGAYSFTNVANGSYTVTPTKAGFTFTPASQAATVNGANVTVAAFSSAAQTFTVSGTITGTGGNAAAVTLTSGTTTVATVTSTTAGAYTFTGVANGSYTVTPTKTGFSFTPVSQAVTVNGANVTVPAFSSAATTFTVSGTISGTGGNAATVTLTSGTTTVATVTSTAAGAYTFNTVANGSYTVTPTKTGFSFTPISQAVTVNGANVTVPAFSSTATTFTVSGTISGTGGECSHGDLDHRYHDSSHGHFNYCRRIHLYRRGQWQLHGHAYQDRVLLHAYQPSGDGERSQCDGARLQLNGYNLHGNWDDQRDRRECSHGDLDHRYHDSGHGHFNYCRCLHLQHGRQRQLHGHTHQGRFHLHAC